MAGKGPQFRLADEYVAGFTPTMVSVLLATDNTAYVKWVSVNVVIGGKEQWFVTISFIYIKINGTNKRNK
jgi:hypothetical protein